MLRTNHQGKEIILRIKTNLHLYSLNEDIIYQSLCSALKEIYFMDSFDIRVEDYLVVGENQQSAYPLITVQNIVPAQNIVSL